jgi:hypothetical protein
MHTLAFIGGLASPALLAAGAAMTAGPVIIHLLNRRRFKILEWAAMEFLLESLKQNRRRLQAEELILLLIRMTLLTLLGLVLAKPLIEAAVDAAGGAARTERTDHVVVIDDSVSMGQVADNRVAFETARKMAADIARQAGERPLDTLTIIRVGQFDLPAAAADKSAAGDPKEQDPKKDGRKDDKTAKDAEPLPEFAADVRLKNLDTPESVGEAVAKIDGFTVGDSAGRLDLALRAARKVADDGKNPNKRFYVISDFREGDVARAPGARGDAFRKALEGLLDDQGGKLKVKVLLQDVAGTKRDNVAVTRFEVVNSTVIQGVANRLAVHVRNYGLTGVKAGQVKIVISDSSGPLTEPRPLFRDLDFAGSVERKEGVIEERDRLVQYFDLPLDRVGPVELTAELRFEDASKDTLPADNRAFLALDVKPNIGVLLVHEPSTGRPGEVLSTFFLRKAVDFSKVDLEKRTAAEKTGAVGVQRLTGVRADERSLAGGPEPGRGRYSGYSVVMFSNISSLAPSDPRGEAGRAAARELENYVRNGGNVVFFLGDKTDVRYFNEVLHDAGNGLFPVRLDKEVRETAVFRRLVVRDGRHPVFGPFKDSDLTPLLAQTVRINNYWSVEKPPAGLEIPVVFDDPVNSPAWIEKRVGSGKVMVFLSGADKEWNNWPLSPSYPIVLVDLVGQLARGSGTASESLTVGRPIEYSAEELADREVRLTGPAGPDAPKGDLGPVPVQKPRGGRPFVRVEFPFKDSAQLLHAPRAGFYRLEWQAPGADGKPAAVRVGFDRNLDPFESRLAKPEPAGEIAAGFKDREGNNPVVYNGAVNPDTGGAAAKIDLAQLDGEGGPKEQKLIEDIELFYWLLGGILALLLIEQFLAYKFSHHE